MTGTTSDVDRDQLLALAERVAREAAAEVLRLRREGVEVAATKTSPTDVVTEVDHRSEELIRARLLEERPGDGFVGEEGESSDSSTGVTWVVDPIDGTVNFLYGIPQYAVSIAARAGEQVVAGVVLDVVKGECFTATRGGGAFLDGAPIRVRPVVPLDQRLVITGFSYERSTRVAQAQAVARLLGEVRDVRRLGSAALDLCYVGAGRTDAYVEEGLHEWDLAAGGLVAEEAGARVWQGTGVGGKRLVVAAPADGFADFAALVERVGLTG
ncbi:inositol monophosphatase family protein [Nocardioides mesophilus]|uniref:Inositol-1-monophosphatase n=1 Tax=Nocardioides mesophilus TaxID=433659 RepID=A0A7G9RBL0_9ACTN|nr:inositol monophosphatase family protein [Nocardioides mesophilus]QNN52985.1 inositol monophosphatase [Nocardioides mesophilus]